MNKLYTKVVSRPILYWSSFGSLNIIFERKITIYEHLKIHFRVFDSTDNYVILFNNDCRLIKI